jgi:hypothetical protein
MFSPVLSKQAIMAGADIEVKFRPFGTLSFSREECLLARVGGSEGKLVTRLGPKSVDIYIHALIGAIMIWSLLTFEV